MGKSKYDGMLEGILEAEIAVREAQRKLTGIDSILFYIDNELKKLKQKEERK